MKQSVWNVLLGSLLVWGLSGNQSFAQEAPHLFEWWTCLYFRSNKVCCRSKEQYSKSGYYDIRNISI